MKKKLWVRAFGNFGLLAMVVASFSGFVTLGPSAGLAVQSGITKTALAADGPDRTPQLFVSGGKEYYSGGGLISLSSIEEPAVKLVSYNLSGQATIEVYRAGESDLLNFLVHNADNKQLYKGPDLSNLHFVKSFKANISQNDPTPPKVLLPLEESGIWFLKVSVGDTSDNAFVVRSKNGLVVKEGDNQYVFWAQSFANFRSQTQGVVRVYNLQDKKQELFSAPLDSRGIAVTNLDESADIALLESGTDVAVLPINLRSLNSYPWRPFRQIASNTDHFLFTDRPIYRPGDTVHFKSISRDDNDGILSIPSGQFTVKVIKDWNDTHPIFEKTYFMGPSGALSGDVVLPVDAGTGDYQIKIEKAGLQNSPYPASTSYASFRVDYYRKPEYSIDLSVGSSELVSGDKLPVTVSGSYFFGQPLVGQTVHYKIFSSDFYDYDYESDLSWALNDNYRYGYWGSSGVIDDGYVVLDDKGEGKFTLDTKIISKNKSQVFSIEAETVDQTQNPSFARKNVVVFPGEYGIYRSSEGFYSQAGQQMHLPVVLVAHRGNLIGNVKLTAHISRTTWVPQNVPGQPYSNYIQEHETLPDLFATTGADGKAEFNFTPQKEGSYEVVVEGKDALGNNLQKSFYAWASGNEWYYYGQNSGTSERLTVSTEKQKYLPGETAMLTIGSSIPDRDVLLSLQRGYIHDYSVVNLSGKSATVPLPITGEFMPNIIAAVSSFGPDAVDKNYIDVKVSADSKRLKVNLTPDKQKYGPGETVQLNIETTDLAGNPKAAEVAVWAMDKALLELADSQLPNIFDTFWSQRYNSTQENDSLAGIVVEGGAEQGGCFAADTQVTMEGGSLKNIQDIKVGDKVLSKDIKSGKIIAQSVLALEQAEEPGLLVFNGNLKVTPNHVININGVWKEAGSAQVGDTLLNSSGQKIVIRSVEWLQGKFQVYNLSVKDTHTFFAQGVWVHNEKGGGEDARGVFKDVAYWNPSVKTGADGRALVMFKLPDNLTTWVVSGVGVTAETAVGQQTAEIVVGKDVVIRPVVPNILRIGDKIILSALVQNFTEQDHNFQVSLKFKDGDVLPNDSQSLAIKAHGLAQIFWDVSPQKESDSSKLEFSAAAADSKGLGDAVILAMPVRGVGFYENSAQAKTGSGTVSLQLHDDADLNKTEITLDLAPTLLGTLPSAMKYLISYPYGCVEQTTSHFVPALLAKEHADIFGDVLAGKDMNGIINTGIQKLSLLQQDQGGWQWWHEGSSDAFITAYVIEYLLKAKSLGYVVDQNILDRAQSYLEQMPDASQAPQNSYYYQNQTFDPKADTVSRVYALALLNDTKTKIEVSDFSGLTPDLVAMAALANQKNGFTNSANKALEILRGMAKTQGTGAYWEAGRGIYFGSQDASTAWAIRALTAFDSNDNRALAEKGIRFLIDHRSQDYWSNTFATAQVIRAVLDFTTKNSPGNPNYSYEVKLNNNLIKSGKIQNYKDHVSVAISAKDYKQGGSNITLVKNGDSGELYSTLVLKEYRTDQAAAAKSSGLKITRKYINTKGEGVPIGVGDLVKIELTVDGLPDSEQYAVIEDQLPSGLVPVNKALKNEQGYYDGGTWYDYYGYWGSQEITENGMILPLYWWSAGQRVFSYEARAVSSGDFTAPPATASLMYKPEVYGRSGVEHINIIKSSAGMEPKNNSVVSSLAALVKSNTWLYRLIGVLILLLCAGIVWAAFWYSNKKKRQQAGESQNSLPAEQDLNEPKNLDDNQPKI